MSDAPDDFEYQISDRIRTFALGFPESSEGTSCVNRAFKAGGKNFVFLGEKDGQCTMRLKVSQSIVDLTERSSVDDRYHVGGGGWTKIVFAAEEPPAFSDLEIWITESFALLAPKKVAALYAANAD